ncbi:MAG: hypothetical protein CVV22_09185 [Ignavibacteriae bacterium HGW-Ignavibacteriae-1]|nr:MAG: hypothetical protein CVV22_09185 [Ignavibacteriae bacterium HGW-Ignavibacteriae-1]
MVNPPEKAESVRVRFINLSKDKSPRTLDMSGITKTDVTPWGTSSSSVQPPADSAFFNVYSGSNKEYELDMLQKFLRNTRYTYFAVPSRECLANPGCSVDTLLFLRTTTALPDNNYESLLKIINLFPDTNSSFAVRSGCPNGEIMFSNVNYMNSSVSPLNLIAETMGISLIRNKSGIESIIKTFEVNLEARKQYVLIVTEDGEGNPTLKLLDEDEMSGAALTSPRVVEDRNANIRIINLSSNEIDINFNGNSIASSVLPDQITDYNQISVCNTVFRDSISATVGGNETIHLKSSIEVLQNYSLVILDSGNTIAGEMLLVEPVSLQEDVTGKAIVRVLHASKNYEAITVSLGARAEPNAALFPNGYSSGTILASEISQGELSSSLALYEGVAPLSIFTASQPAKLLYSAKGEFKAGSSYLLILSEDTDGKTKISVVEDDVVNTTVSFLEEGLFVQVVNAVRDADFVNIDIISSKSIQNLVVDARVSASNSIATVVDKGAIEVRVNGVSHQIESTENERIMFVASGNSNDIKIFANKFQPLGISDNSIFRYRFVNATDDIPITFIKKLESDESYSESVEQFTFSSYTTEIREQKVTFFFYDEKSDNYVNRLSDVLFTLGKSYSVIIAGKAEPGCRNRIDPKKPWEEPDCYFVIIQQEF